MTTEAIIKKNADGKKTGHYANFGSGRFYLFDATVGQVFNYHGIQHTITKLFKTKAWIINEFGEEYPVSIKDLSIMLDYGARETPEEIAADHAKELARRAFVKEQAEILKAQLAARNAAKKASE